MAVKSSGFGRWTAKSKDKRWGEQFYLYYGPVWITLLLGVVVGGGLYEYLDEWGYMFVCGGLALPCFVAPLFLAPRDKSERAKPLLTQWWVKANVFITIFSFVGNYFWTHYFYNILGAAYTFPAHRLNDVPFCLVLMTIPYFHLYHTISNMCMRKLDTGLAERGTNPILRRFALGVLVFAMSYAIAFMETLTISHFPYYTHENKQLMYSVGSLFYAIYFFVSFPIYYYIDESVQKKSDWWGVAKDALAAGMLVTILLDLWRVTYGPVVGAGGPAKGMPGMS